MPTRRTPHDPLVDQAADALGARRVMLVLDAPEGPSVAAARLPRGESAAQLLRAITPWLHEARRTRAACLRHGPQGAAPAQQRSCIVAPLIAQAEVPGWLYADVEGRFGRFDEHDR